MKSFAFPKICVFPLTLAIFAILHLRLSASSADASVSSSPANEVHFCLPLDYEEMRARDSLYAATKQVT